MASTKRFIRFFLFGLFLLEMLLWNPSETGNTIIQKLLLMTGLKASLTGWIYSTFIATLFSVSFPEIWRIIKGLINERISRNLIENYIEIKNKYLTLFLFIGLFLIVLLLYVLNQSIETKITIIEFISNLKSNKPLQISVYFLVPILMAVIWINNRFTILYETSKDELVIIHSLDPNNTSYIISGRMAEFEAKKLLKNKEKNFKIKTIKEFPKPFTVELNLGNTKTNFTIHFKLGVSAFEKINPSDAKWLLDYFGDIEKGYNSTFVNILIDYLEHNISQAKIAVGSHISEKVDSTSDLQVNRFIMQFYPMLVDDFQRELSERIKAILKSNLEIIEVHIPTKKMIPNNIDKRFQEDHIMSQQHHKGITTGAIGYNKIDKDSLSSLRLHAEEILNSTQRPKLFNLSSADIDELIKITNDVFKRGKANFIENHLQLSNENPEKSIIININDDD